MICFLHERRQDLNDIANVSLLIENIFLRIFHDCTWWNILQMRKYILLHKKKFLRKKQVMKYMIISISMKKRTTDTFDMLKYFL